MIAPFLKQGTGGFYLSVKLQPRAARQQIGPAHGAELKVSVTAPAVDAAANEALVQLFAQKLGISRGNIALVRGRISRHKTLFIQGLSTGQFLERLE